MKKIYACQTIVNACLVVEAFVNGLASVALNKLGGSLSKEEKLFLQELREHNGTIKQRFVRTQDKLVEWVKLMCPRSPKVGLEAGRAPYQDFREIQQLRDSIIHLSSSKAESFESIGHTAASRAADVAIAVIREICRCLAADPSCAAYPPWLRDRGPDGLFKLRWEAAPE
jgi:hypothetical protein